MSLFGPISRPLLNEATTPIIRRALQRARILGNFAFVQVIVQLVGFASGILLVRWLDQNEYAYFTIANTMQGTINVLADMGISIGLISIGVASGRTGIVSDSSSLRHNIFGADSASWRFLSSHQSSTGCSRETGRRPSTRRS